MVLRIELLGEGLCSSALVVMAKEPPRCALDRQVCTYTAGKEGSRAGRACFIQAGEGPMFSTTLSEFCGLGG